MVKKPVGEHRGAGTKLDLCPVRSVWVGAGRRPYTPANHSSSGAIKGKEGVEASS